MKRKLNPFFFALTICVLFVSNTLTTGKVSAQKAIVDPNTPVSNTDGVLSMPEITSNIQVSPSHTGTGKLSSSDTTIPEAYLKLPAIEPFAYPGSVIGSDGRTRVTATTTFPNRAIAYLVVTFAGGSIGTCTGWFIGSRTVVTAGHCVYDTATNKWATAIKVYPGRNGSSSPYGYTTAHRLFSVVGWATSHSTNYDYGAIQTNSTLGNTVGWFGYSWQSSNSFPGTFTVRGYPGDKPTGTMWTMNGGITGVNTYRLWYQIDTYGGQSGSPLYHYTTSYGYTSVGVHTYGTSVPPYYGNSATRITSSVFNNFQSWRSYSYP